MSSTRSEATSWLVAELKKMRKIQLYGYFP